MPDLGRPVRGLFLDFSGITEKRIMFCQENLEIINQYGEQFLHNLLTRGCNAILFTILLRNANLLRGGNLLMESHGKCDLERAIDNAWP